MVLKALTFLQKLDTSEDDHLTFIKFKKKFLGEKHKFDFSSKSFSIPNLVYMWQLNKTCFQKLQQSNVIIKVITYTIKGWNEEIILLLFCGIR